MAAVSRLKSAVSNAEILDAITAIGIAPSRSIRVVARLISCSCDAESDVVLVAIMETILALRKFPPFVRSTSFIFAFATVDIWLMLPVILRILTTIVIVCHSRVLQLPFSSQLAFSKLAHELHAPALGAREGR